VLEDESRIALHTLLPSNWVKSEFREDYGLDMQITIVKGEEVSNNVFSVQIKATDRKIKANRAISLPIPTKNLIDYENYPLPVFILGYVKNRDVFYYIFAQKFIKETLPLEKPEWRNLKNISIRFSPECEFKNAGKIIKMVEEGAYYVALVKLNSENNNFPYWVDGIPKSDNKELKAITLKALELTKNHKYELAIKTFKGILNTCNLAPTERMSTLLNIGNAYISLSQFDEALAFYFDANKILPKVNKTGAIVGKAVILSSIGLVYESKSGYVEALSYHRKALRIFRITKYFDGEAGTLNNIGNVYRIQGEQQKAFYNFKLALKLHQDSRNLMGEATVLGNIGNIYQERENFKKALEYYNSALTLHHKTGNLVAEANMLGSIGTTLERRIGTRCENKNDAKDSILFLKKALNIFNKIGALEGQGTTLTNLGLTFFDRKKYRLALKYFEKSLSISKSVGSKHGEAYNLANIASSYWRIGKLNEALQNYLQANSLFKDIGETYNIAKTEDAIRELNIMIRINTQQPLVDY